MFLPKDYKVPSSGDNYMRFEKGKNQFRILSDAILGWEDWQDKKPVRFEMDKKPSISVDPKKPVKHFWAFVVWNYNMKRVQILQITQKSIQRALTTMITDEDNWGDPKKYDITVTREGDGMDTEYFINPTPPKPLVKEAVDAYTETNINLQALFSGADPFGANEDIDPDTVDL